MGELVETNGTMKLIDRVQEPVEYEQNGAELEWDALMEALRDELAEGLLYAHSRANTNTSKTLEVTAFAYALIELLTEKGVITLEELDERKRMVGERLLEKFTARGMGVTLTKDDQDKYSYQSEAQIDCENRVHLCQAACCRLRFALTVQDLEEGIVKWDLAHPYMIRHNANGYCHHLDFQSYRCGLYESRPVVCRSYDCRQDERIWLDFEEKVINPELETIFQQPVMDSNDNGHSKGEPCRND